MKLLEEIRKTGKKPKELLVYLSEKVIKDPSLLKDFDVCLEKGTPAEKGTLMETMEYATLKNPKLGLEYLSIIIEYLDDDAPRVKWEAARVIANLSPLYSEKTAQAIDKLMINTKDKGTVVRWSAAQALGEIAKYNKSKQKELVNKFKTIAEKEVNNGVKNVYLKALKAIQKQYT